MLSVGAVLTTLAAVANTVAVGLEVAISLVVAVNSEMNGTAENCTWCIQFNYTCSNCSNWQNYTSYSLESEPYQIPILLVVTLLLVYCFISFTAVVGNAIILWVIASSRSMHNVTNFYIANLAMADILIGLFAVPFQAITLFLCSQENVYSTYDELQGALLQRWHLHPFFCSFCPFVQIMTVSVSVFTLTIIAIDRHRAVVSPLSAPPSRRRALTSILCIWVGALLTAAPMAYAQGVQLALFQTMDGDMLTKPFCWNMNLPRVWMTCYRLALCAVQYALPLATILSMYIHIVMVLMYCNPTPGVAQGARDARIARNKKKVVKMTAIVVAMFGICWLPLQVYSVLQEFVPKINSYKYINATIISHEALAMSNSCYNPIVYGLYNEKFKRELNRQAPSCCRRQREQQPRDQAEAEECRRASSSSRRASSSSRRVSASAHSTRMSGSRLSACAPATEILRGACGSGEEQGEVIAGRRVSVRPGSPRPGTKLRRSSMAKRNSRPEASLRPCRRRLTEVDEEHLGQSEYLLENRLDQTHVERENDDFEREFDTDSGEESYSYDEYEDDEEVQQEGDGSSYFATPECLPMEPVVTDTVTTDQATTDQAATEHVTIESVPSGSSDSPIHGLIPDVERFHFQKEYLC